MAVSSRKTTDKPAPTRPRDTVLVDTAEAHTDVVAMVSRDKNGNPDQAQGFELAVAGDASDDEKRRAENRPEDNQIVTGKPDAQA